MSEKTSKNHLVFLVLFTVILLIASVLVTKAAHAQESAGITGDPTACLAYRGYPEKLESVTTVARNSLDFWGWSGNGATKFWSAGTEVCILGGSTAMGFHLSMLENPTNVWWTQWRTW